MKGISLSGKMFILLRNKATTRKTTMKTSKSSLVLSNTQTATNAECSQRKASDLPSTCNNTSDMDTKADPMVNEVVIIKSYRLLKEELQRADVIRISRKLFPEDKKLQFEIVSVNKRRRIADILLKRVLICSDEKKSQFICELRTDQCSKRLVESVNIKVTKEDLTNYQKIHTVHAGTKLVLDPARMFLWTFPTNDRKTLLDLLNNEDHVDRINDEFLSKFLFTIEQHSWVTNGEFHSHKKVAALIDEMQKYDKKIYQSFTEVLKSLGIATILQNLEYEKKHSCTLGKREQMPGKDSESDIIVKKMKLDGNIEHAVVSYNRKDCKVGNEFEQIGLYLESVEKGSIVINFKVIHPSGMANLKCCCQQGDIQRFVDPIFNHKSVIDDFKNGEFKMNLSIYESKEKGIDFGKGKFVLEYCDETPDIGITDTPKDPVTEVLLEELDITPDLLTFLKKKSLVDSNIENEIDKELGRKQKVSCLLQNILKHAKDGYMILMESYIKSNNACLYKVLVKENNLHQLDSSLAQSKVMDTDPIENYEMIYHCIALFGVKTEDSAGKMDSGNRSVTCLAITDSKCFFDERSVYDSPNYDIHRGHEKRKEKSFNLGSPRMPKKIKQEKDEEEKESQKENNGAKDVVETKENEN